MIDRTRLDLFEAKHTKGEGCWVWIGYVATHGYGQFRDGAKVYRAHRWSYEHHVGPIPEGLTLDHLCRNILCVNPAHLEPVTQGVNVMRGNSPSARNARKTHCKRGHEFTPENNLPAKRKGKVVRRCRECKRRQSAVARARAKQGDLNHE